MAESHTLGHPLVADVPIYGMDIAATQADSFGLYKHLPRTRQGNREHFKPNISTISALLDESVHLLKNEWIC
ncbi:hypothetical protein [Cryobacterium suzukii]|uniref:hypothetical protein n=1 Tax=Cryobacterium suzukii TaxID=1259198 RepID=UPI001F546F6F|nr:hypothetical protein [Cryobacterium suzukii]